MFRILNSVLICLVGFYRVINLSSNRDRLDNGVYGQGYRSQCEATRDYSRGGWKL